jgi:hypothetical protein
MAELNYKFTGVNTAQLANEVQILRQRSSTFRALEAAAAAAGYTTIEIRMAANLLPGDIADSTKTDSSTRTIRINSDVTASWGVGRRQATVGEVIAHELAHAVVPKEFREDGRLDYTESGKQGMWVRRQAGQVAIDLSLPGPNNADYLATRCSGWSSLSGRFEGIQWNRLDRAARLGFSELDQFAAACDRRACARIPASRFNRRPFDVGDSAADGGSAGEFWNI